MRITNVLTMTALAGIASGAALASGIPGVPVTTWTSSTYGVEFTGSTTTPAKGALYFLGWKAAGQSAITYATSTDAANLGQFLFTNTPPADSIVSIGHFNAGTTLHFAYRITQGSMFIPTGQVQRTDGGASTFFALTTGTDGIGQFARVGIEDNMTPGETDWDYNDMVFTVRAIPAPGAAALMGLSLLMGGARRRRS